MRWISLISRTSLQICQHLVPKYFFFFLFFCTFVCICLCRCFQTRSHQTTWSSDLNPTGKKQPNNFLCQNMSRRSFCFLSSSLFFIISTVIFSTISLNSRCFYGSDNKGCRPSSGLRTEAASTPTAPFVHISVTAERPGQSLRFPRPLSCFTLVKTTGQ